MSDVSLRVELPEGLSKDFMVVWNRKVTESIV